MRSRRSLHREAGRARAVRRHHRGDGLPRPFARTHSSRLRLVRSGSDCLFISAPSSAWRSRSDCATGRSRTRLPSLPRPPRVRDGWRRLHCDLALAHPRHRAAGVESQSWRLQQLRWCSVSLFRGHTLGDLGTRAASPRSPVTGPARRANAHACSRRRPIPCCGRGLVTMGEAWHSNDHAYPGSARLGLEPAKLIPVVGAGRARPPRPRLEPECTCCSPPRPEAPRVSRRTAVRLRSSHRRRLPGRPALHRTFATRRCSISRASASRSRRASDLPQ